MRNQIRHRRPVRLPLLTALLAAALWPLYGQGFDLGKGSSYFSGSTGKQVNRGGQQQKKGFSVEAGSEDNAEGEQPDDLIEEDDFLEDEESHQQDDILYQIPSDKLKGGGEVTVSFHDTDIREVIRAFSIKTRLNLVISPRVEGRITTQLYKTPARSALAIILRTGALYYVDKDDIIQILTRDEYRDYALSKLVQTRVYNMRHGSLKKAALAVKPYMTRGLGKIVVNARTSRLIITDLPERHDRIDAVLKNLQYDPGQVLITAQILEIQYTDESNVGAFYQLIEQTDNSTALSAAFQSQKSPVSEISGGLRINFKIDDIPFPSQDYPKQLIVGLNAVGIEGEINVLSSPRLIVQHNKVAFINIGSQVPFPSAVTTPTGTVQSSFDFVDAGTRLVLIPKIIDKDKIHLTISIESSTASLLQFNEDGSVQAPQKELTEARMSAVTRSGQTVMIGGFIRYTQVDDTVGVPLLKNIPGIKYLFSNVVHKVERRELALFLTPKLVTSHGTPIKRLHRQLMKSGDPDG